MVLASGDVVFDGDTRSEPTLVRKAEPAMQAGLGRVFLTHVRPVKRLRELVESDPFAAFDLPPKAKRVVTFLREPPPGALKLPMMFDGAGILALRGREVLTFYVPQPGNPAFMALLEKTFGGTITTRTWDTIRKCAAA